VSAADSRDPRREVLEALLERAADAAILGERPSPDDCAEAERLDVDLAREIESFEAAIAMVAVAGVPREAPPPALRTRLAKAATSARATSGPTRADERPLDFRRAPRTTPGSPPSSRLLLATAAGMAIGALTTLAVVSFRTIARNDPPSFVASTFLASHPASLRAAWTGTDDPHVVGEVGGSVLFDPASGAGLLVISGLAPNDPAKERYQLWIFDRTRDERYPVDGGVFDVGNPSRVLIPVRARLGVSQPVMFAVTVEKPGGAVVSDRRTALVARP